MFKIEKTIFGMFWYLYVCFGLCMYLLVLFSLFWVCACTIFVLFWYMQVYACTTAPTRSFKQYWGVPLTLNHSPHNTWLCILKLKMLTSVNKEPIIKFVEMFLYFILDMFKDIKLHVAIHEIWNKCYWLINIVKNVLKCFKACSQCLGLFSY